MDPFTAIAILGAHLLCSGALFVVLAGRSRVTDETRDWALAASCFGVAFLGRVAGGLGQGGPLAFASDALMILAALLFARGLTSVARQTWPLRSFAGWTSALVAAHLATTVASGGGAWRFVSINAILTGLYALLAWKAWQPIARRAAYPQQHLPLAFSASMSAVLSAASAARTLHISRGGMPVVYEGAGASAYFALSSMVAVLLVFALLWVVFERLNGELAELASLDALTRVLNRNGLQQTLRRHFAQRPPAPLTLLLVDLDHFKRVNDRHGHAAGDALLRAAADCLARTCRGSDFVARFGGEEFLIGCRADHADAAMQLAERICAQVTALQVPWEHGLTLTCTVSVGVSDTVSSLTEWDAASRQADVALYRAKADGRNRWVRFSDVPATGP
jgi:diguanylate cyclase (GGDEF)-like protein